MDGCKAKLDSVRTRRLSWQDENAGGTAAAISLSLLLLAGGSALGDQESDALENIKRGIQLFKESDLRGARAEFAKAHELVPERANPLRLLGLTEARIGNCESAVVYLEEFLRRVAPDDNRIAEVTAARDSCKEVLSRPLRPVEVRLIPPGAEPTRDPRPARGFWRLYADAGLGFGFGIQPFGNHSEVTFQPGNNSNSYVPVTVQKLGVLFAPFHLTAGFGVRLTREASIGLLGRFQVVTAANASTDINPPRPTALAGLIRFRYQWDRGRIKPYLHADVGAGRIRHAFDLSSLNVNSLRDNAFGNGEPVCQPSRRCVDTVATGLLQVGGGAGLWYDLLYFAGGSFSLVFDFNTLVGVGVLPRPANAAANRADNPIAVNFDLQIGLGVSFL